MFSSIDISTSGLVAQRARLDVISSNLANMSTTHNERGEVEPFQERFVTFATNDEVTTSSGGAGVEVASIERSNSAPRLKHDPNNPLADDNGNVAYPDIDMTTQFVNALEATRAYEANIGVMEIAKDMGQQTLQIIS